LGFGREPEPGDILRYEHVALINHPKLLEARCRLFTEAWQRQLPNLPCPKKFEDGHLLIRSVGRIPGENRDEVQWIEDVDVTAAVIWNNILCDVAVDLGESVGGKRYGRTVGRDAVRALTFMGVGPVKRSCGPWPHIVENQHRARPSTPEELEKPDPKPKDGLIKTLYDLGVDITGGDL